MERYTNDYMIGAIREDDPTAVRVGPWPDRTGWSGEYLETSGCNFAEWPPEDLETHGHVLLNEAAHLMFRGCDPQQILREFAKIKAWRRLSNIRLTLGVVDRAFIRGGHEWYPHNPD